MSHLLFKFVSCRKTGSLNVRTAVLTKCLHHLILTAHFCPVEEHKPQHKEASQSRQSHPARDQHRTLLGNSEKVANTIQLQLRKDTDLRKRPIAKTSLVVCSISHLQAFFYQPNFIIQNMLRFSILLIS